MHKKKKGENFSLSQETVVVGLAGSHTSWLTHSQAAARGLSREQQSLLLQVTLLNIAVQSYCPVPLSAAVCGLPGALSLICSVADSAPLRFGAKVTFIVQLEFIARLAPQLFVCENCAGFVPPIDIPLMVSGAVPEFVKVNGEAVLRWPRVTVPKFQEVGVRVTAA